MKNSLFTLLLLTFVSVVFAQDGEFHLDQDYKISKNGIVDLVSSDAKVFITGSARNNAHVKVDHKIITKGWTSGSHDLTVEVEEVNGDLRIREKKTGGGVVAMGYVKEEYRIEIEVPEGVSLTVRGDDGDYYIKNINGSISMSMDDADAELSDCKGEKFRFRLDDGDLRMNTGRGSLEIDADDADAEIYNAKFTTVDADVDDGDLIIETSLANGGSYQLRSQDGLISLSITGGGGEFDVYHDDGSVTTQGNFNKIEESESRTRLTLGNGNAQVKVRADDARVKLATKN